MKLTICASSFAISLLNASTAAAAEEGNAGPSEPIVVTGERLEYGVKSTATATKTETDLRRIPQALTVISERQIEDQQLRSVGDLLMFVPGATPGTGESNRDQMTLRGNNTTADFFVDGVRDDAQYFRDFYNVDRVEVLRGPNAMIFGRGGGGGIVNRMTKRASFDSRRELSLASDSFGGARLAADLDQPLTGGIAIRVNGLFEDGDSFRRHVGLKRYGIAPTIGIQAGRDTRVDLAYEYFHDRRTADRGLPSQDGRPLQGARRDFFGDPDDSFARAGVNQASAAVEHDFGSGLTLRNRTLLADYDKFYQNIFAATAVLAADGDLPEGPRLGAYNNRNDRRNLFNQTDLVWDGRVGGIDQTLLVGAELGRQKSRNRRLTGTIAGLPDGRVSLDDPTRDVDVTFSAAPSDANNRTRASVAAIYVQDQIRFNELVEVVAGVRFDRFKLSVDDLRPTVDAAFARRDYFVSPRLGLIVKPRESLSLYGSLSRSFLPQSGDQFSGLDINTASLKPERFDNIEAGVKWEPVPGLLATAALYQLDRSNTRVADPVDPTRFALSGKQRSRGLELGLERSISGRWQVSAGYALQKARVIEATTACPTGDCTVPLVPRHSLSLWNRYDVSDTLGIGLGAIARSKSYASISNSVTLSAYARVDGAIYYRLMRGVQAQVNVENILGAKYFATAHSDNNIAPGAPRTVKATLRFGL